MRNALVLSNGASALAQLEIDQRAVQRFRGDSRTSRVVGIRGLESKLLDERADVERDFELSPVFAGADTRSVAKAEMKSFL